MVEQGEFFAQFAHDGQVSGEFIIRAMHNISVVDANVQASLAHCQERVRVGGFSYWESPSHQVAITHANKNELSDALLLANELAEACKTWDSLFTNVFKIMGT
jgi:hypothetical protein